MISIMTRACPQAKKILYLHKVIVLSQHRGLEHNDFNTCHVSWVKKKPLHQAKYSFPM
jgi:hypothetical protein